MIIAKDGGQISLPNGVTITIPPSALDEDTLISLGAVDVEKYDGDVTSLGGVNGLHVTSGIFEPNGTVFNTPAVIRFPLPENWNIETELVLSAANGNNPFNLLPTAEPITVGGSPGNYIAEVKVSHFTVYGVSKVCHSGTYRTVVKEFVDAGCTEEEIGTAVTKKYPDFTIDSTQAQNTDAQHIQAFLGTYFVEYPGGTYNTNDLVSQGTIDALKAAVLSGRQVVIAFHTSESWPTSKNSNGFYTSLPHTATLVKGPNDSIFVHHVISHGAYKEYKLNQLLDDFKNKFPEYERTIFFEDAFSELAFQNFREAQNGSAFKKYVQATFGRWDNGVWVPEYDDDFFTISIAKYNSVKIYIEKRTDTSVSPCHEETCASRGLSGPEVLPWGGYQWQRCDDGTEYNFNDSVAYCDNLVLGGFSDWRLPTVGELMSLVVCTNGCPTPLKLPPYEPNYCGDGYSNDYERPTIDGSFQCETSAYGSSSQMYTGLRWTIWFGDGGGVQEHPDSKSYVRCVRD